MAEEAENGQREGGVRSRVKEEEEAGTRGGSRVCDKF